MTDLREINAISTQKKNNYWRNFNESNFHLEESRRIFYEIILAIVGNEVKFIR